MRTAPAALAVALSVACSLLLSVHLADATYIKVKENSEKCLLQEVPQDVLVLTHYKSPDTPRRAGNAPHQSQGAPLITAIIKDPQGNRMLTQALDDEGRFAFTSVQGGEHKICFAASPTNYNTKEFRLTLTIDIGGAATDYEELAKLEHLSAIEVEVRKLNDKVKLIRAEQDYQRRREEEFRDQSETMSTRIMLWAVVQIAVLVVTAVLLMNRLKVFFQTKKLA